MTQVVDRPINGYLICEKCNKADWCPSLVPCSDFEQATGTNFHMNDPIPLSKNLSIVEIYY